MSAFDSGLNIGAEAANRQARFAEANRIAGRNAQASLIENALNNPDTAPADRAALLQQHAALFQPHEAPDLFKRLSGLIHGQQPAPEATAPAAPAAPPPKDLLGIPITDPDVASAHAEPLHPMATSHPILDRFHEGLDALGNHLKGFSQPVAPDTAKAAADADVLARNYVSPTAVTRESAEQKAQQAQDLAQTKGQFGVTQAEIRGGAVRGVAGHPLALDSAQNLADNGQVFIDKNTGKPLDLDDIQKAVPGAMLTPYYQGSRLLGYEVADQKGHVVTADNVKKVVGEFGKSIGAPDVGVATVPKTKTASSTDQYGNTTSSTSTTTPVQPVSSAAPVIPGVVPTPPNVIPGAPDLAAINAGIQANKGKAGAPSRKAVAPVSSNAPQPPVTNPLPLDANGQIPQSAGGNAQVREFAQQLIDDRDVDKIPAKAKAAAAALARQYGWQQGTFTPKENVLLRESASFINEAQNNTKALAVLDSPISRFKLAQVLGASEKDSGLGKLATIATSAAETEDEAEFIRMYNQLVGTISGLSSLTRSGKATEQTINRLIKELPNPLTTTSSADAQKRLSRLNQELTVAREKGSFATPSAQGKSKGTISLANARKLPAYMGKSDAEIRADAERLNYQVVP